MKKGTLIKYNPHSNYAGLNSSAARSMKFRDRIIEKQRKLIEKLSKENYKLKEKEMLRK